MTRHAPNSPETRDIAFHLHSHTNAALHQEAGPMVIGRGQGVHAWDNQGKRDIEVLTGLWSVGAGFGEEWLVQAAAARMRKLPCCQTFAHRSHGPAIDLAEKQVRLAPVPMSKAYFTSSGSEANGTVASSSGIAPMRWASRRRKRSSPACAAGTASSWPLPR